jgi:hypothetical protein
MDALFLQKNICSVQALRGAIENGKIIAGATKTGSRSFVAANIPELDNKFVLKFSISQWQSDRAQRPSFGSVEIRENISRVFQAMRMQSVINSLNLTHVKVPQKYLYHIPNTPDALTDENYIVVAEQVDFESAKINPYKAATYDQVKELACLMVLTDFTDTADGNVEMDKDGHLVFPDTDNINYLFELDYSSHKDLLAFGLFMIDNFRRKASGNTCVSYALEKIFKLIGTPKIIDGDVSDRILKNIVSCCTMIGSLAAMINDITNEELYVLTKQQRNFIISSSMELWINRMSSELNKVNKEVLKTFTYALLANQT